MNRFVLTTFVIAALMVTASCQTRSVAEKDVDESFRHATSGMTVDALTRALAEIRQLLPQDTKLCLVSIKNDNMIMVQTQKVPGGPLSGSGEFITYTFENGHWVEKNRSRWIS